MSPRQINEDGGRQIRKVWLGAKGLRWPWNWTFEEWALAFIVLVSGWLLLLFIVPAGIVTGVAAAGAARAISRLTAPEAPRRHFWAVLGCVAGACLLISANPATWIRPLWFPFAMIVSAGLPFLAVRLLGPYLNWNRPMTYWVRLPLQVSRGPRAIEPATFDPAPLIIRYEADPEEIITITNPPKTGKRPTSNRRRWIQRTPEGFRVGRTEYRIEWTF